MSFDYSLAAMLPFARSAIRNTSNFSPEQFATLLFGELEKVSAPGVSRNAPTGVGKYNFSDLQVSSRFEVRRSRSLLVSGTSRLYFAGASELSSVFQQRKVLENRAGHGMGEWCRATA